MRVLLVDFDAQQTLELTAQLETQHLSVLHCSTPDGVLALLNEQTIRVVIVGMNVPGGPGVLTQNIRAAGHGTPVLVISDVEDEQATVALLDDGVDDVLVRPYPPDMLTAQIRSLLRRCTPNEGAVLKFEDLSLDLRSLQVMRQGQLIPSTSRELAVLEYLLRNRQRVVSRSELSKAIWEDESLPGSNVIEVFIARLRRKVDRPFDVPLIHTIVGRGYMLSVTKPGSAPETN